MDKDMQQLQNDLLESVRDMKAGRIASITHIPMTPAAEARTKIGLSQKDFATLLGVSPRTLQDWEQGRRSPTGAARTLLAVAMQHPEIVRDVLKQ